MKIMFIIPRMNGGGAERVVANLANSFSKENKVMVCTLVSNESFYDFNSNNIDFKSAGYSIDRKNKISTLNSYRKLFFKSLKYLKRKINEFDPDCIISFLIETDILTYLVTRKNKKIVRINSERNDPTRRKKIIKIILKHIYKKSDLFICQSKKIYDYYKYIDVRKKVIISNPIDNTKLPQIVKDESNHNIVSVGRLTSQKNFELLINSFIIAKNSIPEDSKLIIYGEGKLRSKLEELIASNKLKDRILLPGAKKDILDVINGSALFVMSSNYEGFPNALLEAMSIGLPVISTDFYTGVAKELIKKDNGIIVGINNELEMSEAIIKMMNSNTLRNTCRHNNIKIRNKYNIDTISSQWMKAIEKEVEINESKN